MSLTPAPAQYTTNDGSLTGAVNGANYIYTAVSSTQAVAGLVFVNGILMTQGLDATLTGNVVTLSQAPQPG